MRIYDVPRHEDLIFDVGAHIGQDTGYYLKKGFRVVAVEADPELCEGLRVAFAEALESRRLTLVEAAISTHSGSGKFYKFGTSVFGTVAPEWAKISEGMGHKCEEINVEFISAIDLYREHGIPYFLKIDIEGVDNLCIEALEEFGTKPRYISVEAEKYNLACFIEDARLLAHLGYGGFQLVRQDRVLFQPQPSPPREGNAVVHRFSFGASGLFGKDLPEDWITIEELIESYRPIVKKQSRYGTRGLGRNWFLRQALRALALYPGWHDLHARLGENV